MKPKRILRLHDTAHNLFNFKSTKITLHCNIPMHGARIFATPVARVCDFIKQSDLLRGTNVVVTTWRRVVVIMNPLHDAVGDPPSSIRHSTRKHHGYHEGCNYFMFTQFLWISNFCRKLEIEEILISTNLNHFLLLCKFVWLHHITIFFQYMVQIFIEANDTQEFAILLVYMCNICPNLTMTFVSKWPWTSSIFVN